MVNEKYLFMAAGILVLAFVAFMLLNSASKPDYSGMPIDESIPQSQGAAASPSGSGAGTAQMPSQNIQVVSIRALSSGGYDNPNPKVKAGVPVRFEFSADPGAGCGRQLILDNVGTSVNLISLNGETVTATFTPPAPGQYKFHCGMNMFRGVLTAT